MPYDSGCFKLLRENSLNKISVYNFGKDACGLVKLSELFAILRALILVSRVDLFLKFFTTL